jgi:hypothetical protein
VTPTVVYTTIELSKTGRDPRFLNVNFEAVNARDMTPHFEEARSASKEAIIAVESPNPARARYIANIDGKVETDLIQQTEERETDQVSHHLPSMNRKKNPIPVDTR